MANAYQTNISLESPGVNQLESRNINDTIRYLNVRHSRLTAFVRHGVQSGNKIQYKPGFIKAKGVAARRVETFTRSPIDFDVTVSSVSSLDITVSSALTCKTRDYFFSPATQEYGVVDAISSNTLTIQPIGGSTFAPNVGDNLMFLGNIHEEGSSTVSSVHKGEDHIENYFQKFRAGIDISWEKATVGHEAGGRYEDRHMEYLKDDAMRMYDRQLFFGAAPASGYVTSLSTLGVDVGTSKGMWEFATNEYDFNSSITRNKLIDSMAQQMDDTVGDDELVFLTGKKQWGKIIQLQNDQLQIENKMYKEYGIQIPVINCTVGKIKVILYDVFNNKHMDDKGFLFIPNRWTYYYLKGNGMSHDIQLRRNIQLPKEQKKSSEFYAIFSLLPDDGGLNAMKIKGLA